MTIVEFRNEARDWAREYWWNGAGVAVIGFLIAAFIWKRPDNDYLLYAALLVTGVHAYISNLCFVRNRAQRKHREEIAVAYREQLQRENARVPDRPTPGRYRRPALGLVEAPPRLVGAAS